MRIPPKALDVSACIISISLILITVTVYVISWDKVSHPTITQDPNHPIYNANVNSNN